jgi:hypothetical protein
MKDRTPQEVSTLISWLVTELEQAIQNDEKKEEEEWLADTKKRVPEGVQMVKRRREEDIRENGYRNYVHFDGKTILIPNRLPPMVLSDNESEELKKACEKELLEGPEAAWGKVMLPLLKDFVHLCQLLSLPENYVKTKSSCYVEKQVNSRTYIDMSHEISYKLTQLPRFTAYVKLIREMEGNQFVLKTKIETSPLPPLPPMIDPSIKHRAIERTQSLYSKTRSHIDEELYQRQENWQRNAASERPPPNSKSRPASPEDPSRSSDGPPPTHT